MSDGIIEGFIKNVLGLLPLDRLKEWAGRATRNSYYKGMDDTEVVLDPDINIIPNQKAIDFLEDYAFENIKGMKDDLAVKLRHQLVQAMTNGEGAQAIKERVMGVLDVSNARAATIARTETHRAYNIGSLHTAEQSGLRVIKRWHNPSPQAAVCKALAGRTASLDETFKYQGDEWLIPPAHPNCRSRINFEQVDEEEN